MSWDDVWINKGLESTDNLKQLNGYELTNFDANSSWKKIKNLFNIQDSDTILEVGCGAGYISQYIKNQYTGIDKSNTLLKKHFDLLGPGKTLINGEASNIPFQTNSFDYVICIAVLHYMPDIEYVRKSISEMVRVSKKGVFIGNIRKKTYDHRPSHFKYNGPYRHLIVKKSDFPDTFKEYESFYDENTVYNMYFKK